MKKDMLENHRGGHTLWGIYLTVTIEVPMKKDMLENHHGGHTL